MSCERTDLIKNPNGLCYNYTFVDKNFSLIPIGWWDIEKRLAYRKPVLPSQDFFKFFLDFKFCRFFCVQNDLK
jgi:hypothetical protein